jgi:ABC-type transporter Mla subunit MlaD
MGTRRLARRVLIAVVLALVALVALVVLLTWGTGAGGSRSGPG